MNVLGFDINDAHETILELQSFSTGKLLSWQNEKRWSIANFHFLKNINYKKKVGNHFPKNWNELPIMEKSDYQNNFNDALSFGYTKKNTFIASTSGSSGHPFYYAKNKEAHAFTWALAKSRYNWYDINLDSRQARFYGIPLNNRSRYFEKIKDLVLNRIRFNVFDLSDDSFREYLKIFKKNKFKYLYGYANSLVLFARFLINKNIVLKDYCPSLVSCISTSEMLTIQDRKLLEKGFGIIIINEYGISEAGGITAFQNKAMDWCLSFESQYIEIVDQNNENVSEGIDGDILITDLHNKAMPFIRYRVGDIGRLIKKGNKIYLDQLIGRTNDNIILPNGKVSPGLTFYYIARSTLEKTEILKEFIIRQISIDTFIFDVVCERDLNQLEIKNIKKDMDTYLVPNLNLRINRVNKIRRPNSGKIKHFYSQVDE